MGRLVLRIANNARTIIWLIPSREIFVKKVMDALLSMETPRILGPIFNLISRMACTLMMVRFFKAASTQPMIQKASS